MKKLLALSLCCLLLGSAFSQEVEEMNKELLSFLVQNTNDLKTQEEDLSQSTISSEHTDINSGIRFVYVQQRYKTVKVYNAVLTVAIKENKIAYSTGSFINGLSKQQISTTAGISPIDALKQSAAHLDLEWPESITTIENRPLNLFIVSPASISKRPIEVELVLLGTDDGSTAQLVWNVNIDVLNSDDWWNVQVDAFTGAIIRKDNWTVYEQINVDKFLESPVYSIFDKEGISPGVQLHSPPNVTTANYNVIPFPFESPAISNPSIETNPWLKAGMNNNATTYGWHFDGSNNYEITRGNNVFAYLDVLNNNSPGLQSNWPDTSSTSAPTLNFIATPDFNASPLDQVNKKSALTNLFYWNNITHDVFYQYGFDEAAGNFQYDNLGRGGSRYDHVLAEAQDNGGSSNANFNTPPDGTRPRMQMYLWANQTIDGSMDNSVIVHEYGHGISNRLTGGRNNSSCLSNAEHAGEGWSDYFALMLTTDWTSASLTDGALPRTMGSYVTNNIGGIRRNPYSTDMNINPVTYIDLNNRVHDNGEIWCSALWDLTWKLIETTGVISPDIYNASATGGNIIAMKLVMTALKLQKCSPGFLDSRDALLTADTLLFNNAYSCIIWSVFARRGMGVSANQGSPHSIADQVASFDVGVSMTRSTTTSTVSVGNQLVYTTTLTCKCASPSETFILRDTIPPGFNYISSTGGVLNGNVVSFNGISFTAMGEVKTYSTTLQALGPGCAIDTIIHDDRDTHFTGGFVSTSLTGSTNWDVSPTNPGNGIYSWRAQNMPYPTDFVLTSNPFQPGQFSFISFLHYYDLENSYDGGTVELSTDGVLWIDAKPYMIENAYNATMHTQSPFAGADAFSGESNGIKKTIIDVSAFSGQPLQIRFRMRSDASDSWDGWFVDDIVSLNACGYYVNVGLYNSNEKLDGSRSIVFITPTIVLPLTLIDFNATKIREGALLKWITESEVNTRSFEIEFSTNSRDWLKLAEILSNGPGDQRYHYVHNNPVMGRNFYRLRMIDNDERYTYSPVRSLYFDNDFNLVIQPNPSNGKARIQFAKQLHSPEISIYDGSGRLLHRSKIIGSASQYILDAENWATGMYTVTVASQERIISTKLIITR